ncbi:MAG: N-acetylmuramoyl-L-alanine amidase, partial [Firmicutes bacterium]|nr:N-acetylmuramoyl-L-alanine amidase [Bacillota bacterium]
SIKVNDEDKAVNYPGGQKVSVTVKKDTKVDVTFAIRKYKITAKKKTSPSGNGGTITGSCYVKYGGSKTFKITPKFGYIVNKVYVDGKNIGRKYEYTFKDVKEKHRITAIFKKANVLKIMLDAGHVGHCNRYVGKFDGGYYYESLMSWQLHKYLKKDLEEYNNVIVDTTRSSLWRDLGVYERGYKAKGYDLFISLHSNYCDSPKTDYPLVIRQLSANQSEKELAAALSQAIGDTMGCREEPSVWTRYYRSGGKKVDYYGVLRGAHAAGCNGYILEHSFHSNRKMALWLYKKSNLRKMARKEANVIAAHYGLRKKDGTAPSTSNVLATPCRVKVTASSLTVRKKAGVSYKKLGTLGKGGVYTIVRTSSSGKWGKLSCDSSGWISLKYVKKVSASSDVRNYTVRKNVSDSLNIRKGPGTKYKSIGKIRSNKSKYTICSETKSGRWGKLKNREGWISLDCVKRVY